MTSISTPKGLKPMVGEADGGESPGPLGAFALGGAGPPIKLPQFEVAERTGDDRDNPNDADRPIEVAQADQRGPQHHGCAGRSYDTDRDRSEQGGDLLVTEARAGR
jgi:hypothetical protein